MSRVMLITGANRGIGAATARLAAQQGYALCLNYHQRADAANAVLTVLAFCLQFGRGIKECKQAMQTMDNAHIKESCYPFT